MSYLGPVNFQGMRLPAAGAGRPPVSDGVPLCSGRSLVDPALIDSLLHRPHVHHQAENLWCATQELAGTRWGGSAMPAHIERSLQSIQEYHGS